MSERLLIIKWLFMMVLSLGISGCATGIARLQPATEADLEHVLSGVVLFGKESVDLELPVENVLGLDTEVTDFLDRVTRGIRSDQQKLKVFLKALFDPLQLAMVYEDRATLTASEVFRERKANCLSFTTLIVPALRYLGIQAAFNEVDVPPVWDLQNRDMLILYHHVNAIAERSDGRRQVVDINMAEFDVLYPQRMISDQVAEAQYFNNRAMQYLMEDNFRDAFRYLRKALELAPDLSFLWVNLGAIYRKQDRLMEAETAYRRALEIAPDSLIAISNLERVYQALGKIEEAGLFRRAAAQFRNRNPYYLYTLAMSSYVAQEHLAALENIRLAIRRFPGEHRFYFLQGAIYSALGDAVKADDSFNSALELSSDQEQERKYRRKIDRLHWDGLHSFVSPW
ncbi:MAG: hypothetical protein A3I78_07890 [Gammaproteobacteria bacterium RIFCSPLOWO2_02_FULL_56_15]|nr:MAG: hypothetical protein A3I78_07890 [Gammaproteobacteria bacterium RIFCSPLOWO2_02_FULL_56_15]